MFSFIADVAADESGALVSKSRETLRALGRQDEHIALHLPFSPASTLRSGSAASLSFQLPTGLATLKKTAVVEIHSPSARNALSGKLMAELADVVTLLEDPEVHGKLNTVVLRGTGGWFCAGANLRVAQQELSSREGGAAMGALMVDTLTRFRRLPLVSFACIEGGAYGGGAELATACDFRLVESKAIIQFVQNSLRLLCTAEKLSAARALELKLVDQVFDAEKEPSDTAITAFVAPFDVIAPAVSHGAKLVINNADDVSLDGVLSHEQGIFRSLWAGPANLEALEGALKKGKKKT